MKREAAKIREWLREHPNDRRGPTGGLRKSNLTDNESAKLSTDKGVIQGYSGIAVVDASHQIIVEAQAHGTGAEQELLLSVLDACAVQRKETTVVVADAGYHSEANLAGLAECRIDALIADPKMRQRDERFAEQHQHRAKPDPLHDKSRKAKVSKVFGTDAFTVAEDHSHAICPAGQRLYRNGDCIVGSYRTIKFRAPASACRECPLRAQCLRTPGTTLTRQFAVLIRQPQVTYTDTMRRRIDSDAGRRQYGRRLGIVEPVFANLRHNKRLTRFTLRGRTKVDGQWKLFALVHNIEKLAHWRKTR
jgi:hypothetical protein